MARVRQAMKAELFRVPASSDRKAYPENLRASRGKVFSNMGREKRSRITPWIEQRDPTVVEVRRIACCDGGATRTGNSCDLGVKLSYWTPQSAACVCNLWKHSCRIAVERKDSSGEIFRKHPFHSRLQCGPPLSLGKKFQSIQNFSLGNGCYEKARGGILTQPTEHPDRRGWFHQFGKDVRIQNNHLPNRIA